MSVEPDECRLLLLAFEVCSFMVPDNAEARDPPRLLHDYSFWNLLETYIMPIREGLVSGNGVGVCGILTRSHTSYSPSSQT